MPARGSEEAARRVVQLVTDSIPRVFGMRGATRSRSSRPVHRGPAGTQALNRALKAVLNPGTGTVRGFDVGDRVVATANHLDAEPTGYANGEVGTVVSLRRQHGAGGVHRRRVRHQRQGAGRPAARLGDHRAPRAGFGVGGGGRGAAAGGRRHAVPAAGLHRADPGPAAPVGGARGAVRCWPARCSDIGSIPRRTRLAAVAAHEIGRDHGAGRARRSKPNTADATRPSG